MNYHHLLYFQKLAKYEHYRKAAEELNITQPSLSNAIHQLEQELGVPLFEKSGRGVRLTKTGARYLEYVNHALRELETGAQMLHYEQIEDSSLLRLGLVMSIAYDRFPEWITGFLAQTNRSVFFSCINDTSDALALELMSDNVELIVCSRVNDPRICFFPLFNQQLILLLPEGHRFSGRKTVDIHELNGEAFIAHSRKTALHDILADIYRENNIHVRIISEADEDRAIIGMVRAGLGCGVTTQSSEIFGTGFAAVPITGSGFEGQICVGRRENAQLSEAAAQFYDYLVSQAGDL